MDINTINPSSKDRAVLRIIIILAFPVVIFMGYRLVSIMNGAVNTGKAWESLSNKSEAHRVLVRTYRNCRSGVLTGSSVEECHIVVKEYAEIKGFRDEFPKVLEDISKVSESIKQL